MNLPATREWKYARNDNSQKSNHSLCYYLLDADEALHAIQYLVTTYALYAIKEDALACIVYHFDCDRNRNPMNKRSFWMNTPLRKFDQFPAHEMYQSLRWPAQILAGLPRGTSAIPAQACAGLAPSVGEMDELFMAAEQKNGQKI